MLDKLIKDIIKMASSTKYPLIALALSATFGCTAAPLPSQTISTDAINGQYSVAKDSGIIVDADPTSPTHCAPGSEYAEDGNYCIEPIVVHDLLTVEELQSGDLAFDIMTNAFNGHSCGARGVAQQTPMQNVWRFEQNNDGAICKVDISVKDGAIVFEQDYSAGSDCSYYCGNRAALGANFPLSSLK